MNFRFKLLVLSFLPILSYTQEKNDVGFSVGASYYMGDFNLATQFYMPSPSIGIMLRHNLNDFYSIRLSGSRGQLKGVYNSKSFLLPNLPNKTSFNHQIVELSASLEVGFRPFATKPADANKYSPYVTLGVGAAYADRKLFAHFPFGIGIKFTPFNRWTFGLEWSLHKTFTDGIDGYSNLSSIERIRIHNYDWVGIGGLCVSYRLVNEGVICPVYD